jgi:DNA-binding transcriptional LysR family regulator
MKKPDWNHIRAFHATATAGSLSAAARQLGLTQPTLSRQVAALEAELGVSLFSRIGRRPSGASDTGPGREQARRLGERHVFIRGWPDSLRSRPPSPAT